MEYVLVSKAVFPFPALVLGLFVVDSRSPQCMFCLEQFLIFVGYDYHRVSRGMPVLRPIIEHDRGLAASSIYTTGGLYHRSHAYSQLPLCDCLLP